MTNNLVDRLAIQDIMTRYAAGVDDRDLQMYRDCFADDAEIVGFGGGAVVGADAWTEEVKSKLAAFDATQHMLGPQMITIEGDTASTRTDVQALHYLKNKPGETLTLWAVYLTNYRRIDGEWKITRHELVRRGTRIQSDE
ncbi:MAG: hypothetical protein CMQ40_04190 [Gammaproteobacteria bacterium]|nr:hypothetical protein [Gammaproteobacteria bacterium]